MLSKADMKACLGGEATSIENLWTLLEAIREFGNHIA